MRDQSLSFMVGRGCSWHSCVVCRFQWQPSQVLLLFALPCACVPQSVSNIFICSLFNKYLEYYQPIKQHLTFTPSNYKYFLSYSCGVLCYHQLSPSQIQLFRMLARLISTLAFGFYRAKWTHHLPRKNPQKALQTPFKRWLIVRGDTVQVRAGDDKGKIGRVVKVLRKKNRVVVRGVNVNEYSKTNEEGKRVRLKRPCSLHISNVGLYDSSVRKPVRVKIAFNAQTNERLRISKKTGRILYKRQMKKLKREKRGKKRKLGLKDTPAAIAHKVTYQGQDFQAIRKEFLEFIAAKQARQRLLVFKQ